MAIDRPAGQCVLSRNSEGIGRAASPERALDLQYPGVIPTATVELGDGEVVLQVFEGRAKTAAYDVIRGPQGWFVVAASSLAPCPT